MRTRRFLLPLALAASSAFARDVTFTYDANGNVATRAENGITTKYSYDPQNRLVEVRHGDLISARYQYDHRGRVILKIGLEGVRQFVYDGDSSRVLAEYDVAGNPVASFTWAGNRLNSITRPGESTLFPTFDGLGSVVALSDSSGNVVARYHYDAWGNYRNPPEATANANRYGFTGHRWEPEIALYNANSRRYDAALGRFTSADALPGRQEDPASLHRYTYAHNNPLKFVDPDGTDVRLVNDTPEGRQKALDTITKNLTVPEQRNVGYRQTRAGHELYLKDPNRIDPANASPGYRYLQPRVEDHRVKINYVVIEEGRSFTAQDQQTYTHAGLSGRAPTAAGTGELGSGLTVYYGKGNFDVMVPEGGAVQGVKGLTPSGREVIVANPDYVIAGHELFGETERFLPGNEALQRDWIAGSDKAIAIENEIRAFHGLPLRSGTDHGYVREEVTVTPDPPKDDRKEKKKP